MIRSHPRPHPRPFCWRWCPQVQCSAKFHSFFNKFSTLLLHNNAKVESGDKSEKGASKGAGAGAAVALHIINLSTSRDREDSGISSPPSLMALLSFMRTPLPSER
ncbi:hypothetical protein M5D96_006705 [Drosophila gunungcola]|uniref:Uncharacterized protein n=1 Tax=Drosophila gunungcola TaxID=103775 RepID=A0A9Q0BQD8_9MUSC|nr:hypothetical protein M5D96_006705 [Drosophila gunungcola]